MPINSFDDYPMSWKPDLSKITGTKYIALAELLENDIKSGKLKAGTKLPPQRELADFLDLNLSTISKVYKLCGQKGLLSSSVGNGTYVSSDATAEPMLLCGKEDPHIIEMGAIVPFVTSNLKVKQYAESLMKKPDALNLFPTEHPKEPKDSGLQESHGCKSQDFVQTRNTSFPPPEDKMPLQPRWERSLKPVTRSERNR